jgi:deoxyribodipyrimidine photo-lyase
LAVPETRIAAGNDAPVRAGGDWVLYWMIAARRTRWSFGLDRAIERARELEKPLLVLEPLRNGYEWASPRFHRWVMDGMADNARAFADAGITYHPYLEAAPDEGKGLLEALAERAAVVVTDEYPAFFLPRMVAAAAERLPVRLETVDSNGLLPLRATDRAFPTAHAFRRFLQRDLPDHLLERPATDPLAGAEGLGGARLPADVAERWPAAPRDVLEGDGAEFLAALPIDHDVPAVSERGGPRSGAAALARFLRERLPRYGERNHPDEPAASGLSPWLHFGHVSAHEVAHAVLEQEEWTPSRLSSDTGGARRGWWGASEAAEGFLDELVTWRELGHVFCFHRPDDYDRYESLPDWARQTLREHEADPRPSLYGREELEAADTHDPLWNAAQRQLVREGRLHNYLRMLWGKKILEWSPTPRVALDVMIELNNRYALDGRDPNSYSGIFWVLGRFDRAWGPEREIFGKIRYMSSENTAKKLRLKEYLARWGEGTPSLF